MNPTSVLVLLACLLWMQSPVLSESSLSYLIAPTEHPCATPLVEVACSLKWRAIEGGWEIDSLCFSTCGASCIKWTIGGYTGCSGCGNVCNNTYKLGSPVEPNCNVTMSCQTCAPRSLAHSTWTVCTCP
jgi:hypothetical protein